MKKATKAERLKAAAAQDRGQRVVTQRESAAIMSGERNAEGRRARTRSAKAGLDPRTGRPRR
jgi:hypothetical protein